jgi:hypothetical protein
MLGTSPELTACASPAAVRVRNLCCGGPWRFICTPCLTHLLIGKVACMTCRIPLTMDKIRTFL